MVTSEPSSTTLLAGMLKYAVAEIAFLERKEKMNFSILFKCLPLLGTSVSLPRKNEALFISTEIPFDGRISIISFIFGVCIKPYFTVTLWIFEEISVISSLSLLGTLGSSVVTTVIVIMF